MAEHEGESVGTSRLEELKAEWRYFVDTRLDYLRDDVGRWADVAEIYGREVVVSPALAEDVLRSAEDAAMLYAAEAVSAGLAPPARFDSGLEVRVRDAVNAAIDVSLEPDFTLYPDGAVAHDPACLRQGDCECLDIVRFVSERARRRDPDLASDMTEAALRKAERGGFRTVRDAERAAPRTYARLRIDVLRRLARAAGREQAFEGLERVAQRPEIGSTSRSIADVLADLLPVTGEGEDDESDWQESWSYSEARQWLAVTALGAHVLACLDDGRLELPPVLQDEGRSAFVGVCTVSVAAHCLEVGIVRLERIEGLLAMSLVRAVGGKKKNGGRAQRVRRTLPAVGRFIESLAEGPFASEPLAPPPTSSEPSDPA